MTYQEFVPLLREFCRYEGLPDFEEISVTVTPFGGATDQTIWRWKPITGFNLDLAPMLVFQAEDPEEYIMAIKAHYAHFSGKPIPQFPSWKAFLEFKANPRGIGGPMAMSNPEPTISRIDPSFVTYFNVIQSKPYYQANAFPTLIPNPSEGYIHTAPDGSKWIVIKPTPFNTWLCLAKT